MITETELRQQIVKECNETSQADVARRLKVSRAYISDIVRGKRTISNKIAAEFGYRHDPTPIKIERNYVLLIENKVAV